MNKKSFGKNYVKIKSSWFDKESVIKKIGTDGFYLYLHLYLFYYPNQQNDYFHSSIYSLKKETGFTEARTLELFRLLIKNKLIECSVKRWDRYINQKEIFEVEAIDMPQTHRENKDGNEIDMPNTDQDYYIIIDMKMVEIYKELNMEICCFSIYSLINKYNSVESKCNISINEIAKRLNVTNDRVHKAIYNMNRNRLMYSHYRRNKKRIVNGKSTMTYKFEHYLFNKYVELDIMRNQFKDQINNNIEKWDKKSETR